MCVGARLAGARSSRPRRTCGPRSTSSARWRWPRSATGTASRGRSSATTTRAIRRRIARVVPGCAAYEEKVDAARRLRAAAPAARLPHASPPRRARRSSRSARPRCCTCPRAGCCCRPCARTTSSTPRSTGSTTATAASRTVAGWCFVHPDDIASLGLEEGQMSTSSASGRTAPSARPRVPRRLLRHPARLRRGLLPRGQRPGPARLRPTAATSRRTSPWSCASSRTTRSGRARRRAEVASRGRRLGRPRRRGEARRRAPPPELTGRTDERAVSNPERRPGEVAGGAAPRAWRSR